MGQNGFFFYFFLFGFGRKLLVHFGLGSIGLSPRLLVWFGPGLTRNVRWADFSSSNLGWWSIFKILGNKNFEKNFWITHFWLWFGRKFLVFRNSKSFLTFQKCIISHFFAKSDIFGHLVFEMFRLNYGLKDAPS